jgi:hypothetical protein
MRMALDDASMAAVWMSGVAEIPERSGEICVAEIFGNAVRPGSAAVGTGVKAFRDPRLTEEFEAVRLPLDVAEFHDYAVDWTPGRLVFSVDGEVVRELDQAPDYPVQLMIGVFDLPAQAGGRAPGFVPELVVSAVRGATGQPSARLMCAVIRSVSSGHSARGRSWPMPSMTTSSAPGTAAAVARPPDTLTRASSEPWITRVGTVTRPRSAVRSGLVTMAAIWRATPAGSCARS